jgi:amino acid transporter
LLILWRHAWGYWLGAILGVVGQVVGTVGLLGFFGWGEQQGNWGPLLVLGGLLFVAGGLQWRSLQQSRATFH